MVSGLRLAFNLGFLPVKPAGELGCSRSPRCDLCLYEGEVGARCLFIPGNGRSYVCPELIVHYMNAHGYAPPAEFCDAVLACPPMRSQRYFKELLANGGRTLVHRGA